MVVQDLSGQVAIRAVGDPFDDAALGNRHMEILSDLSARLLDAEADADALSGLFQCLRETLNIQAQFGFVARVDDVTQLSIATGELPEQCLAPLDYMAKNQKEFYLCNLQSNADPSYAFIRSRGYRAFASEPISAGDELQGVLCFGTDERDEFAPEDLTFFRALARYVALAMDRTSKQRALEEINRELQHRVNNMLSMVQAVALLSRNGVDDLAGYQRNFDERLLSLARTHNLLTDSSQRAGLRELLVVELGPLESNGRLTLSGPSVVLSAMIATTAGLVIHELASNAVKFGALSTETGTLSINWAVHGELENRRVLIHWIEEGGPSVDRRLRHGYGANLLDRPFGSDFEVHREFLSDGVRATIALALD